MPSGHLSPQPSTDIDIRVVPAGTEICLGALYQQLAPLRDTIPRVVRGVALEPEAVLVILDGLVAEAERLAALRDSEPRLFCGDHGIYTLTQMRRYSDIVAF